ncbi:MAG: hypothetical protein Ct9H300mP25_06240 [Acidobacteriota bacterium]|nr:MAG: hypothetical protein Ct9H300mP25_06240 [Acidobacteriota bacterium]
MQPGYKIIFQYGLTGLLRRKSAFWETVSGDFCYAARKLGVEPASSAVVEDALVGVRAAKRGGFGLVVGIDRTEGQIDLSKSGADLVVTDLEKTLGIDKKDLFCLSEVVKIMRNSRRKGAPEDAYPFEEWRLVRNI